MFFPTYDPSKETRSSSPSGWLSGLLVVFVTLVVNALVFIFVTGPQTAITAASEAVVVEHQNTNLQLMNAFLPEETQLLERQRYRLSVLNRDFPQNPATAGDQGWQKVLSDCNQARLDISRDTGVAAAFETTGFDWTREWAKAQARAISSEEDTWEAVEDIANAYIGRTNLKDVGALANLKGRRLKLRSALAELDVYSKRLKPLGDSEAQQTTLHIDALNLRSESVQGAMKLAIDWLKIALMIVIVMGLFWFIGKLTVVAGKQQERRKKFEV